MRPEEVSRKRFSVIGAARSGTAAAELLQRHGAAVFVSDASPAEKLWSVRKELERLGIPCEFGGHTPRALDADVIVLSPGVPSEAQVVRDAIQLGRTVVSEIELASWFCRGPMIAITGTNGKTTTTTLTGRMFSDAHVPAGVGGNIGVAFSTIALGMADGAVTILEVSSFQLDHITTFRPTVAVLLNITPDHLDRYGYAFENYVASKCRVFENQKPGDVLIYNADDGTTRARVESLAPTGVVRLPFSTGKRLGVGAWVERGMMMCAVEGRTQDVVPVGDISIRGIHNLQNAMASTLAALALHVPVASLRATLRNFKGVEHRLEFVREWNGITFVNDSKATNVDSVWYALQSFTTPIVLLLGGRDKGNDYARLTDLVRKHVKAVIAIGESAEKVRTAFAAVVPTAVATNMEDAVRMASIRANVGDTILLSPACASFDWFTNYEHRGRVFKEIVMNL